MKVSIIIPSYNSAKTIEHTLRALAGQTAEDMISEIIVVDSSDDRGTKSILSGYKTGKTKIIDAGIKVMPAIGRNIGSSQATGEILAFIDSDAYPAEDWVENIVRSYKAGCKVGGGSIVLPDFQKNNLIARAQYYLEFNEYISGGTKRVKKKFVPSCNMFCDSRLFKDIGGFPEIRAAEDVLFGLKAAEKADLYFVPDVKVYHVFIKNWIGSLKNQMLLGKYVYIYRRKHYGGFLYNRAVSFILTPAFVCIKLLRIVSRLWKEGSHIYYFLMVLPLFLTGLIFWSTGFMKGCLDRR